MQKKVWYYEKWVGHHASFPPKRSVNSYINSFLFILGELDTLINFTAKQSISRQMETNPKAVKELLISNCAQVLACYRKNCSTPSSAGQLILPECMKLLPLYTNCLLKSDAISGGADVGKLNI